MMRVDVEEGGVFVARTYASPTIAVSRVERECRIVLRLSIR